jgi:hypothetical protein
MSDKWKDVAVRSAALQKQLLEAMQPVADLQRKLQEAMRPAADLQARIQAIRVPIARTQEFDLAVRRIVEHQKSFAKSVERLFGPLDPTIKKLAQAARNMKALDGAGFLPHYSMPFSIVEECQGDSGALRTRLVEHFQSEWAAVRKNIEARVEQYDIDEEAKATLREALGAHQAGYYRSVCRVLLPEIERVARIELHGDKLAETASQPLLRKRAGTLTPASIDPPGFYGFSLFRRLTAHLYERIRNGDDRARFAKDPVPNRHAAVHGLVVYSSMQNSLSTIFMADFIFQVISVLKKEAS